MGNRLHFNIRVIHQGERYGLEDCLTHEGSEPMIEFYDPRYPHTEHGQFVARYYLSTFFDVTEGYGLCLDGGIPDWSVSASQVSEIKTTLSKEWEAE